MAAINIQYICHVNEFKYTMVGGGGSEIRHSDLVTMAGSPRKSFLLLARPTVHPHPQGY